MIFFLTVSSPKKLRASITETLSNTGISMPTKISSNVEASTSTGSTTANRSVEEEAIGTGTAGASTASSGYNKPGIYSECYIA